MGIRRETRTGRSAAGNVHLHAAVVSGVRGALHNGLGGSAVTPLVLRLPQFVDPSVVTPICVVDVAPRAVRCPFPVRHSLVEREVGPVTGEWSIECDLKECNSVKESTLSTAGVYSLTGT